MKVRIGSAVTAAVLASLLAPSAPATAATSSRPVATDASDHPYASDRAIVGVVPGERADAADLIDDEGGDVVSYNRSGNFFVVDTATDSAEFADDVEGDGSVRYAEPDWKLSVADVTAADPSWNSLWGLQTIAAPAAWQTSTGSGDVVVGVIDSGVDYTHEDLASQMWVNPNEDPTTPADDDNNGWKNDIHGVDCANDDSDPSDDNGHGTHVAGTIGAAANNGKGISGTAWNVKIMALKFLGADGTGYTSDAIQCLYYAINNGAHLTNNSWGGPTYSKTLHEAIKLAASKNQLFIAAAGNDGVDTMAQPHFPAAYDAANVISVAATDRSDNLASFSNYGADSVDLAAPGTGILSTVPGGYASFSGTSMAAPHVSGAAVLLMGADASLRSDAARLRAAILDNVDEIAALNGKVSTGGRLNVARAVWPDRPTSMHIHGIGTSMKTISKLYRRATLTASIATDKEAAVGGATVTVTWSTGGTSSCTTSEEGTCSVAKRIRKTMSSKLAANVASVSHGELAYEPSTSHVASTQISMSL